MASRRGRGEGGIGRRPDGSWYATWKDPRYGAEMPDGRRNRHYVYGDSKAEVIAARKARVTETTGYDPSRETLGAYLKRWLEGRRVANKIKVKTHECYAETIARYIDPHLGGTVLSELTPAHVNYLLSELERAGKSTRARELAYAVLHAAIKPALVQDLLPKDPFRGVEKPRGVKREVQWWDDDEMGAFITGTTHAHHHDLYVLALWTGMREGELLGLQWSDVDLKAGVIHVRAGLIEQKGRVLGRQDPKSASGKRTITLMPAAAGMLRRRYEKMFPTEKVTMLRGASEEWVFPNRKGGPQLKSKMVAEFRRDAEAAGVKRIRFHDLRHTYAMWALRHGMDVKTLSELLGHADVATTLRLYVHKDHVRQAAAVAALAEKTSR